MRINKYLRKLNGERLEFLVSPKPIKYLWIKTYVFLLSIILVALIYLCFGIVMIINFFTVQRYNKKVHGAQDIIAI